MASGDDIYQDSPGSGSENISDVVEIDAELWGAYGGVSDTLNDPSNPSVIIQGVFDVSNYDDLYWYVGGEGSLTSGGFNGGGDPGDQPTNGFVYGGGGGTDIRVGGSGTSDRILVAGGGGGQGWNTDGGYALSGGAAGFDEGGEGISGDGNTIAGGQSPNAFNDPVGNDEFQGGSINLTAVGGGGGGYWAGFAGATNDPGQSGSGGASYYDEGLLIGSISGTGSYSHNNRDGIVLVDYRLGPQVDFDYSPTSIVAGDTVNFSETVTSGYYSVSSYSWDLDLSTASGTTASQTYNDPGSYDIILTVTDSEGYSNDEFKTIDVQSGATVDFDVPADTVQGFDITFTDQTSVISGESKEAEEWYIDGTYVDGTTDLTYNFDSPGTKNVKKVVRVNGVDYSETKTVTIDDAATVDFSYSTPVVSGIEQTFTDETTVVSGATREAEQWVIDGASVGTNVDLNYTFESSGDYSVGKIVTVNGYDYSSGQTVTVEQNTTADFTFSPSAPLVDEQVSFTDQSVTPFTITSYSWDFGDGTTSTNQNPSHTYTDRGEYTVSLTVEDDQGQTSTDSQVVEIFSRKPTVETDSATNVGDFEATLNGSIVDVGVDGSADVYFEYREVGASTWNSTPVQTVSSTGSYSETLTNLNIETDYEYRAVGENSEGTLTASTVTFSTNNNTPPEITVFNVSPDPIERFVFHDVSLEASDQVGISSVTLEWFYEGTSQKSVTNSYSSAGSISETFTDFYEVTQFGDHSITVTVEDDLGSTNSITLTKFLGADTPTITLTSPSDGATLGYSETFDYQFSISTDNAEITSGELIVQDSQNNIVQSEAIGSVPVNSSQSFSFASTQVETPETYTWLVEANYENSGFEQSNSRTLTVSEPADVSVETGNLVTGGYGLTPYGEQGYGDSNDSIGFNYFNSEGGVLFEGNSAVLQLYFQYRKSGESAWQETSKEEYDTGN